VARHAVPVPESAAPSTTLSFDPETRRLAVTSTAAAAIGWWPAFTLGVYQVIFFEQQLALWAAATTIFVVSIITHGRRAVASPTVWTLLLPSLWIAVAWAIPVGGETTAHQALFWFGVAVTVLGMPVMAALLVRLLLPGAARLGGRQATTAGAVVMLIMVVSFALGTQQERILTCEDFTISGNFAPPGCSPGTGTTELD
jgi:hypothetical protein